MDYIFNKGDLNILWDVLQEPPLSFDWYGIERHFAKWVETGWAFSSDLNDVLESLDNRLGSSMFDLSAFMKHLQINWEVGFYRPRAISSEASGFPALRVDVAAHLLGLLEQMGFCTDPAPLVDRLLEIIRSEKKKVLSEAEVNIWRFHRNRHKHPPMKIGITADEGTVVSRKTVITSKGYRIIANLDINNSCVCLEFHSPKYRTPVAIVYTVCVECGYDWRRGDPDSSAAHRKEHKRRMNWLAPKPLEKMLSHSQSGEDCNWVDCYSPRWLHSEVYERALAFKREMRYDFIQWQHPKAESDLYAVGYLFLNEEKAIVGVCSFQHRKKQNGKKQWGLAWIWICPGERRKGYLSKHWDLFKERFKDFEVEGPLSDAMAAFLIKKGDSTRI